MSKKMLAVAPLLIALLTGACSKEEPKSAPAKALENAKEGAAKAGDAIADAWNKTVHELDEAATAFQQKVAEAKPEAKAKMESLKATFDKNLALAKQKWEEARTATADKAETLKKQADAALEAAKQAWHDAGSN